MHHTPLSVDPSDIRIVETSPSGLEINDVTADVIFEEEDGDERGGWGNKLVSLRCRRNTSRTMLSMLLRSDLGPWRNPRG